MTNLLTADSGVFRRQIYLDSMTTAVLQKKGKVICDFFGELFSRKPLTLFLCFIISLITIVIIRFYGGVNCCGFLNDLKNINTSLLGIDIAALAILFALLQGKELDKKAKEAFEEQSITFLGNAMFQFFAITLYLIHLLFHLCFLYWFSMGIQIFALIAVFDLIIEMYTLTSLIKNK